MPKKPPPPPEEARAGLPAAVASARLHLTVAELMAAAGHYGPACSHLILAQEESVKAKALGWIWLERDEATKTYDEAEIRDRLSGHPARHEAAIVQSWSGGMQAAIVARVLRETIREQAERQGVDWSGLQQLAAERGGHVPALPSRAEWEAEMAAAYPAALDEDWPDRARELKDRGFYADQVHGTTWRWPGDVTEADYLDTLAKVRPMVERLMAVVITSRET